MADVLDRIVVQVVADVNGAQSKIDAYAKSTEQSMKRVEAASTRMGASGQILQHVIRSTSDALAAGAPLTQVFGQQMGRLTEAAELSGGAFGKFGAVLSGPMGLAVSVGVAALIPLIGKLLEAGDATGALVQKVKEDAEQSERTSIAKDAFTKSVEGQEIATRELNKEMLKEIETSQDVAIKAYEEARAHLAVEIATRKELAAKLDLAKQVAQQQANAGPDVVGSDVVGPNIAPIAGVISELDRQIAQNAINIADAETGVGNTFTALVAEQAKRAANPMQRINDLYDQRVATLKRNTVANKEFLQSLDKLTAAQRTAAVAAERLKVQPQFNKIEADRKAALKAEQEREAAERKKVGDPSSPNAALLASAERFRGDGETGAGRSALLDLFKSANINIDPKITAWCAAFVNAVLATNGLPGTGSPAAKSFLGYGTATNSPQKGDIVVASRKGGGHVGFFEGFDKQGNVQVLGGNTGGKVAVETIKRANVLGFRRAPSSQGQADELAKRNADEAARNQSRFLSERDRLNDQALAALQNQTTDADELARIARDRVLNENDVKTAEYNLDTKYTDAQKATLKAALDRSTVAQLAAIAAAQDERLARERLDLAESGLQNQEDILGAQLDLADTTKQRYAIEQQLLDLKFQELRLQQQAIIDSDKASKADKAQAAARLAVLDKLQPLQQQSLDRKYESPGKKYLRDLNSQADELSNAFEGVAVNGLQSLNDQLTDAIVNSKSLGEAFHSVAKQIVADLLRIALQQAIIKPLANALFGGSGGVDTKGGIGNLLSGLFHGGQSSGSILSALSGAAKGVPGFASGGSLLLGGRGGVDNNLLSLNGRPLARVSAGEMLNVSPRARASVTGGLTILAPQQFDLSGVVMTEDMFAQLDMRNRQYANAVAGQAGKAAVSATPGRLSHMQRFGT